MTDVRPYDAAVRTVPMLVVGATFTGLLLVLPAVYSASWTGDRLSDLSVALVALPFAVLLLTVLRPLPALTHFGYFAAHLPALALEPGFTGSDVYSGPRGLFAVVVVGLIGLAWVWVCRWSAKAPPEPSEGSSAPATSDASTGSTLPAPARWLGAAAGGMGVAVYAAFAVPAVGNGAGSVEPLPASIALLVGVVVAWYVAAVQIVNAIGDVALDGRARRRVLASLFVERRRTKADIWTSVIWLVGALVAALLWYLP